MFVSSDEVITLTEFRQRAQFFLDASKKNPIYIRKGMDVFKLEAVKMRFEAINAEEPEKKLTPVTVMGTPADVWTTQDMPDQQPPSYTPFGGLTMDSFSNTTTAPVTLDVEQDCCKNKQKQCKHWSWDGTLLAYKNELSGRIEEPQV